MTRFTLTALRPTSAPRILALCLLATVCTAEELSYSSCAAVAGTYLATVTDREGVFASRTLLTFSADGALLVTDSGQSGAPKLFDPISSSQGHWDCVGSTPESVEIKASAFSFVLADQEGMQTIGRTNYALTLNAAQAGLTGTAELIVPVSTDLEGAEPITDPGDLIGTFGIDAIEVN